jgi:hypothetical protein
MPAEANFDSTDLLFYFSRADTAIDHILPSGKHRLSPLGNTGDPIEYPSFDIMISGTNLPEFDEINQPGSEAVAAIDRIRREESFVACLCKRYSRFVVVAMNPSNDAAIYETTLFKSHSL